MALDTPLPTVDGWTTMGDVAVGDWLFDERGQPCRVTGVSPTFFDRECFAVCFDDGERVICDADHRWPIRDFTNDIPARKTLTTRQMLAKVRLGTKRYRYGIDVCKAVELPTRDLLIHPYLLGFWLGDGNSIMNHLSVHEDDEEIVEHLQACGVQVSFRLPTWCKGRCANVVIDPTPRLRDRFEREGNSFATHGSRFTHHLRMLDVLDNKHIPPDYLRAGKAQRLALLQGLMDSDGSITPDGKRCEFSNTNRRLIEGAKELLAGLGYKASVYTRDAKTKIYPNGAFYTSLPGWRISWTAYAEEPMFRLSRKVARMRSQAKGKLSCSKRRRIVDIRPMPSVPVRCIEVDSPNHLYLCGKEWIPTHNTECGNNFLGYVIHMAPGPMMAVAPTVEMAKRNSKQRIDPLIEESPALLELIAPARSRDSGNTILAKEFRGGVLVMTGANSAVGLRSMPVRYLFLDEVDGYPRDVEGEGDAISLAEARTRTFARRKIFIVSTPTISGASVIEREYDASDQRRYFVPCPHCGQRQWLKFEQLRWTWGKPETAQYVCVACGEAIAEHHKTWMLEQCEWCATSEEQGRKTVGFHLSSLYSPIGWRAWSDIAGAWESAQGSATALKAFKNTELGETWVEEGDAPDWERLFERREAYPIGHVPLPGLLLTAGADIQKDRIEVSVWAFGRGKSAWLIEHRILMGPVYAEAGARDSVWQRLADVLRETWTHESGAQLSLSRLAVDTGFATQEAYAFVRTCKDSRVLAVKGVARGAALIGTPTAVDVTLKGKKLRRGIKLFSVAGPIAKLEFYNNLRKNIDINEDGQITYPAGFIHLPKIDAEFVQQLCAEQLVTRRDRNGFPVREWQKMRERNEGLDCFDAETEVLTYAGWKPFPNVGYGDLLATVDLESDLIEYQAPKCLIDQEYQGELLVVEGRRLNFAVTPGHRMVTYKKYFDRVMRKWRFDAPPQITLAQDLTIHHTMKIRATWRGNDLRQVHVPASYKQRNHTLIEPDRQVDALDLAIFLGWYIAEGSTKISVTGRSVQRTVSISQSKPQGRECITALLNRLPWQWHWTESSAVFSSRQLYDYIISHCPGLQPERRVPQWIKDSQQDVIAAFVDAAIAGDGWSQKGCRSFATTSQKLADDMAELFLKLGGSPSVTRVQRGGWHIRGQSGDTVLPQFWVRENNKRRAASLDGVGRQCMVRAVPYHGRVYCASVPNGTLIVRRQGKMLIAGNCFVYSRAAAANAGLDRFEERHWCELEKQLGIAPTEHFATPPLSAPSENDGGGASISPPPRSSRRLIRSRWLG